jgi:hypothetical protein
MKPLLSAGILCLAVALASRFAGLGPVAPVLAQSAQQAPASSDGPQFTAEGELIRPANFRDWRFVTAGLGMTYSEPTGAARTPNFTNVWVNPASYRAFMSTGKWPDKTMFILEVRASTSEGSINKAGHFQSNLVVIEASVKDESRYGGWAYFDFGRDMKEKAAALPRTERCYACHADNTAVDNTFVQFYPTLMEVAQRMGTLRPGFASKD